MKTKTKNQSVKIKKVKEVKEIPEIRGIIMAIGVKVVKENNKDGTNDRELFEC